MNEEGEKTKEMKRTNTRRVYGEVHEGYPPLSPSLVDQCNAL